MSKLAGNSRAALLGALFAIVGFSYAIASHTEVAPEGGRSVGARGVGTSPLRFTNPIDAGSGERDLGDIVAGSGFVRWVRAAGGVQPYKFVSSNTGPNADSPALATVLPLATLLVKGELIGTTALNFATAVSSFQVTVTDSGNSNGTGPQVVRERFRLTLVTGTTFRFANDSVPSAVRLQDYVTRIELLNGRGPFTYSIVTGSVTLNGTAISNLETAGLQLSRNEGTLFGKPTVAGTLVFKVRAVDASNTVALGRSPATTQDQTFSLTIAANNTTSSVLIATSIQIKGDTAVTGKDSIKYAGVANLGGTAISAFSGDKLVLRVADYVTPDTAATPAALDAKGKTIKPTVKDKTAPTVKAAISSSGQVKVAVGKESFGNRGQLGTLSNQPRLLVVSVQVGDVIIGTEVLRFDVKTNGTKFQLTYKLGKNIPAAGGFILTSVQGKDDTKTNVGDTWKAAFVALPTAGTAGNSGNLAFGSFAQSSSAVVSIGANFSDSIGVSESKDKIKTTEKASKANNQVSKVQMDAKKGKGSFQTTIVATALTAIPRAATAGDGARANFTANVTLTQNANGAGNVIYSGEGGATIFAKKTSWSSKNPNK